MAKIGEAPNWLPSCLGVTAFASNLEVSVRAACGSALLNVRGGQSRRSSGQDAAEDDLLVSSIPHGPLFMILAGIGNGENVLKGYFLQEFKATDLWDSFGTARVSGP